MVTKNDDSIMSKVPNDKYRDGQAANFNKNKCERCGKILGDIHTCTPKEIYGQ